MPLKKLTEIAQLPRDAEDELPAGDEKFSGSKGTLGWWVIVASFSFSMIILSVYIGTLITSVSDLEVEIKELKRENRQLLIDQINKLQPMKARVDSVEQKVDFITPNNN